MVSFHSNLREEHLGYSLGFVKESKNQEVLLALERTTTGNIVFVQGIEREAFNT